ncbi:Na+-driven multidrug efflux pump [Bacilli bacterium PM5-3]|nr:Na+-driven multidrug efflux pump [Bacilli bacterium PM5-3]MDH6603966.1 Na+-driven multidrug efflux pump [Bacilli bacterium PM5-9]
MQSITSITTFLFNGILISFTTTAIAIYGIYSKLQNFIFMHIYGLMNGMLPIMAYNYGAKQKNRVLRVRRYALLYMVIIMSIGMLVFQVIPSQLLDMFNASTSMKEIGIPALRIISIYFIFEGFCLITQTSFQSLGKGFYSLLCSVLRQIVILLPIAYLLSLGNNINYIWIAFPITGIVGSIICWFLWKKVYKNTLLLNLNIII